MKLSGQGLVTVTMVGCGAQPVGHSRTVVVKPAGQVVVVTVVMAVVVLGSEGQVVVVYVKVLVV